MKTLLKLFGGVALVLSASSVPVMADDHAWTGGYAGISGGLGWARPGSVDLFADSTTPINLGDSTNVSRGTLGRINEHGGFAGAQIGYNRQSNRVVYGFEADIQGSGIKGQTTGNFSNPFGTFNPIAGSAETNINWFGTARGRLGLASNNWLVYGTGGFAFGEVNYRVNAQEGGGGALFQSQMNSTSTKTGFVWGGGVEYALGRYSIKAEYQHIDLGSIGASAPVTFIGGAQTDNAHVGSVKPNFDTVRIGLNAKF